MADIDISSYYSSGDEVKVIASGTERIGVIEQINATALTLIVADKTKPIFLSIRSIETIELVDDAESTGNSASNSTIVKNPERGESSIELDNGSNKHMSDESIQTWYERMIKKVSSFDSYSSYDFETATTFVKDVKSKIDSRTHGELERVLKVIKYALDMNETDDKFSRLQQFEYTIIDIYLHNKAPKEVLLMYTFLCRIRSDLRNNRASFFSEGIIYSYRHDVEISEMALAMDGKISDALRVWKYFTHKPEVLIHIMSKGFVSSQEKFGLISLVRDMVHSSTPSTITLINGVLFALLRATDSQEALRYSDLLIDTENTKEELFKALETAFSSIAIHGFVYSFISKSGKSCHLLTPEMEIYTFQERVCSSFFTGDYLHLLVESESMNWTIVEYKSHNFTLQEYQSFIEKFQNKRDYLSQLKNNRFTLKSQIQSKLTKEQSQKIPPQVQNELYATLQKRKVKATTPKECLQVINGLVSIAEIDNHPKRLTAVKDILEIYGRKVMSEYVSKALEIIDRYNEIFTGEERTPFVRLCIPLLVKLEEFDRAIESLNYIQEVSPSLQNINNIAWCYFRKKDFKNAIHYALKVVSDSSNSPTVAAAFSTLIYSYLNEGEIESAEKNFSKYTMRFPNSVTKEQIKATIENVKKNLLHSSDVPFQVDTQLEAENYISDVTAFPVKTFTTKYLKYLLDGCEFVGIKEISVGKDGKNYYDPKTVENAIIKFRIIANEKETRMTDAQGVQKNVFDRNLTIAWLARYCLDSGEATEEQIKIASNAFLTSSAKMLLAKARSIMMGGSVEVDYLRMIFSECIILLARMQTISLDESSENLFLNIPEFYTAFNAFTLFSISKELGTTSDMIFWRYKGEKGKTESDSSYNKRRKDELSQKTTVNFKRAWKLSDGNPELLCKSFIHVLSDATEVSEYLKPFLCEKLLECELVDQAVKILKSNLEPMADQSTINSIDLLLDYLDYAVRNFISYQDRLLKLLHQATDNLINNQNPEQVSSVVLDLKGQLENPLLRSRDRSVLNRISDMLLEVCKMFDEDIYDTVRAFSEKKLQEFKQLRLEILENPTTLTFGEILDRIDALVAYLTSYIENLTQRHLPEMKVWDDQEDEGYSIGVDSWINVQLRIKNADRKTPSSNITLKFFQTDETRLYYSLEETILYTGLTLPGGESAIVPIKLMLTNFGRRPDTPIDIKYSLSYRTVQNQTIETDINVITITTKSIDGYIQIDPNPYKVGSELRAGEDDEIFFGRDRDIEIISNMLVRGRANGTSIAIYGQFRCGKSSLKNYVVSKIESLDPTVIVANMEIDESGSMKDFVHSLIHQICRNTKGIVKEEIQNELKEYDVVKDELLENYPVVFLCDFLQLLKQKLNYHHVLVTIDEFGRIFSDNIPPNFMQYWKQMMSIGSIDAIVVGHDVLTQQMRENRNEFAAFSLHQLNYLPKDSAVRLIQNPIHSDMIGDRFKPDAVKYIYEMTAGNAFYIQQICFHIVNFMNQNKLNKVNANQVKGVIKNWFANTETETLNTFFHPLFMSGEKGYNAVSDDEAKKILKAIAMASERNNGLALKSDILNFAEKIDSVFSNNYARINRILESLESRWVIDKHDSDKYEIRVKLYQEYLLGKL